MLQGFSWQDYGLALLIALGGYYSFLILYCYQSQLRAWWRKHKHKR